MPLIRAFGRFLRRRSTDEASGYSRAYDAYDTRGSDIAMAWVVLIAAVVGIVPVLTIGLGYELVRLVDRPNILGTRGHWAVALTIAIGLAWFALGRPGLSA